MFRLSKAFQNYCEAGSLNEQINLLGFLDEHVFLTKSGDVGVVITVTGVDFEGLNAAEIDQYTKRLEAAVKILDDHCRVYQYLFKRNNPPIPHREYQDPVVSAAIRNRVAHFKSKADRLYSVEIFYVVLLETPAKQKTLRRILQNNSGSARQHQHICSGVHARYQWLDRTPDCESQRRPDNTREILSHARSERSGPSAGARDV